MRIVDPTNMPWQVFLNGVELPTDTLVSIDGEKIIAESKILDGVAVFERICRKPFDIDFSFNLRDVNIIGQPIFPQELAYDIFTDVWTPDQVIPCQNTFMNKIGINDIVIKKVTFVPIRGHTTLPCTLKCLENYNSNSQKTTLIVPL
jgi:hypothetical protein